MYDEIIKKINKARKKGNEEEVTKLFDELKKLPDEEKMKIIESKSIKDKSINISLAESMESDSLKEKVFFMSRYKSHSNAYILVRSITDDEMKDKLIKLLSYGKESAAASLKKDEYKVKYIDVSRTRDDYLSYVLGQTELICSLQDDELKEQYLYEIRHKACRFKIIDSFTSREYVDRHSHGITDPNLRETLLSKFEPKDENEAKLREGIASKRKELSDLQAELETLKKRESELKERIKGKEKEINEEKSKL